MAVAPPFLGVPKTLRVALAGDKMGLDGFISDEEALVIGRNFGRYRDEWPTSAAISALCSNPVRFPVRSARGSIPWLLPIGGRTEWGSDVPFAHTRDEGWLQVGNIEARLRTVRLPPGTEGTVSRGDRTRQRHSLSEETPSASIPARPPAQMCAVYIRCSVGGKRLRTAAKPLVDGTATWADAFHFALPAAAIHRDGHPVLDVDVVGTSLSPLRPAPPRSAPVPCPAMRRLTLCLALCLALRNRQLSRPA